MKLVHLILPVMILTCSGIRAQEAFYKHFEGKVGENIHVVLDLVAAKEKLSGYYYYYFADQSGDASWTHFGKSMPVTGTITTDKKFTFSEFATDFKGAVFQGACSGGVLTGTWTSADGKKQLPFEATESYADGTMAFGVIYMKEKTPLLEKSKTSPMADLELSLLIPSGFEIPGVVDSVKAFIFGDFFGKTGLSFDAAGQSAVLRDTYFTNYRASNADIYQEGMGSFNWSKIKEIRILHNEHYILSLEHHDYGYTGGAHGLSVSRFQVIDLHTGRLVGLDEIFRPDYRNDLRDIINSEARKAYGLDSRQGLTEAGFFSDFIDPSDNFFMTKDGIGFYYNQYEVAPYAMGPVSIFVSYTSLRRILAPESIVFRLID